SSSMQSPRTTTRLPSKPATSLVKRENSKVEPLAGDRLDTLQEVGGFQYRLAESGDRIVDLLARDDERRFEAEDARIAEVVADDHAPPAHPGNDKAGDVLVVEL